MTKQDPPPLKRRQKDILDALRARRGEATVREIANDLELSVNGVSQSLGALKAHELVWFISKGRSGADDVWRLRLPRVGPEL